MNWEEHLPNSLRVEYPLFYGLVLEKLKISEPAIKAELLKESLASRKEIIEKITPTITSCLLCGFDNCNDAIKEYTNEVADALVGKVAKTDGVESDKLEVVTAYHAMRSHESIVNKWDYHIKRAYDAIEKIINRPPQGEGVMDMEQVIGKCSLCGGDVVGWDGAWHSIMPPPPPKCVSCGAHPKGTVIEMVK